MSELRAGIEQYLAVRRALGYKLVLAERLLGQFCTHYETVGADRITVELALAWATLPASVSPGWQGQRFSAVRGFAVWLQTIDPSTEVPPADLLPYRPRRAIPYLYTDAEIAAVMAGARGLPRPLQALTYEHIIGLVAATGLRMGPDGRQRTAHVHTFVCLWYTPFHTRAIKVILIRNPGRTEGFDVALASTDPNAASTQLIARYDTRWTIETCHQEAKAHGVGEARNRVQKAVERTAPFGFLAQTITITWYQLHGNPQTDLAERRRDSPWYRQKTTISYTDMLASLRRELIRHEYQAQAPTATTAPQITRAPSPSALIAA
ncbi:MAG: hypothetical protein ACR2QA_14945 [Solirubrobacteraceae bacterium]